MSQPNINVEKLEELLKEKKCITQFIINQSFINDFEVRLTAAFPPQPKEEWRPRIRQQYFYVDSTGEVEDEFFFEGGRDELRLNFGNCFPTHEAAEAHLVWYKEMLKKKV